jgi:hypothetical protein
MLLRTLLGDRLSFAQEAKLEARDYDVASDDSDDSVASVTADQAEAFIGAAEMKLRDPEATADIKKALVARGSLEASLVEKLLGQPLEHFGLDRSNLTHGIAQLHSLVYDNPELYRRFQGVQAAMMDGPAM